MRIGQISPEQAAAEVEIVQVKKELKELKAELVALK